MSLGSKIFYNTLAQSVGKIFAAGIGLLTLALLSRHLGEQGFGAYSTVVALLGFFAVLADFGLYLYTVREISKPETNHARVIGNALGLRLVLTLGFLLLGALIAFLFPYGSEVKQSMFVGIGAFAFVSLNQVLVGVFQKHLVQYLVVISETAGRIINLVLVYLAITKNLPLPFFVGALVGANFLTFLLTLIWAQRYEKFDIAFEVKFWAQILKVSWPLAFSVIFNLLYFKTDTVILSWFHSPQTVGVYSLPYRLLEGLIAFPAMFVGLVMPLLSAAAFASWGKFREILQRAFDAVLLLSLPAVLTAQFFAQEIINLVKGGEAYADSPAVLQILILSAATIFFGTLFGYAVVAVNEQKAMLKGYGAGAALGLILYFSLIPKFSYWGAAWGTFVTELVVTSYAFYLVTRKSRIRLSVLTLLRALPAGLGMILLFLLINVPWVLEIVLGLVVYLGVLIIFRAIPRSFLKTIFLRQ